MQRIRFGPADPLAVYVRGMALLRNVHTSTTVQRGLTPSDAASDGMSCGMSSGMSGQDVACRVAGWHGVVQEASGSHVASPAVLNGDAAVT
jgi:hypothetical protein